MDPTDDLALSTVFFPETGTQLLPFSAMFAVPQPVELDLGCGKGGFLLARARAHPEINFVGVERMLKRVRKVDSKIKAAGLTNVRLLRVECMHAVRNMLPEESITTAYIFFPDPWPKRRHQTRRLISTAFVEALCASLTPGGTVHIMTDHLEYFEAARSVFARHSRFSTTPFPAFPEEERTDFEKVFTKMKRQIGRCSFRKVG